MSCITKRQCFKDRFSKVNDVWCPIFEKHIVWCPIFAIFSAVGRDDESDTDTGTWCPKADVAPAVVSPGCRSPGEGTREGEAPRGDATLPVGLRGSGMRKGWRRVGVILSFILPLSPQTQF